MPSTRFDITFKICSPLNFSAFGHTSRNSRGLKSGDVDGHPTVCHVPSHLRESVRLPACSAMRWLLCLEQRAEKKYSPALSTKSLANGRYEASSLIHLYSEFSVQISGFTYMGLSTANTRCIFPVDVAEVTSSS